MEKIIELIIDEQSEISGIQAISIVENPAIEEDFIALKEHNEVRLAEVDAEKRILMGPALIPNKKIFRKGADDDENNYDNDSCYNHKYLYNYYHHDYYYRDYSR